MGLVVGIVGSFVGAALLGAGLFLLHGELQTIRSNSHRGADPLGQIGIGPLNIQASDKIIQIVLGLALLPAFWYVPLVFSRFEEVKPIEGQSNRSPVVPSSPPITQVVECGDNLLSEPWHLEAAGGAAEDWIDFDPPYEPTENDGLQITYNLHGLRAREGAGRNDSVIVLTQPNWYGVSLATLSTNKNGFDGEQTAYIPLTEFHELPNSYEDIEGNRPLTWGKDVSSIRARFWNFDHFRVDITSIRICHGE